MSDSSLFEDRFARQLRSYAERGSFALDGTAVARAAAAGVKTRRRTRAARWPLAAPEGRAGMLARAAALGGVALVAIIFGASLLVGGGPQPSAPPPTEPPPTEALPSQATGATDTPAPTGVATGINAWLTYTSAQYGISVGYPDTWAVSHPATRPWQAGDTLDPASPSMDTFFSESQSYRIAFSVWQLQAGPAFDIGSWEGLASFAEALCREMGDAPCDGIPDRAVPMCLERRDCHAALLVPFDVDQLAYFGDVETGELTIVAVWRMDLHPSSVAYGGSVELLRSLLTTMNVWPLGPGQGPGVTDPPGAPGS